jgi:hypothetical protein
MNAYIYLFLLIGAAFGLGTYARRHLFSEGPRAIDGASGERAIGERILWMLICAFLWPIMVLSGLNSLRILRRRQRQAVSAAIARPDSVENIGRVAYDSSVPGPSVRPLGGLNLPR